MTPIFWFSIALLSAVAVLFVVVPVLRFRSPGQVSAALEQRREKNREVYEQRLRELEREASEGLMAEEDVPQLRTELQRAFLRDMDALEQQYAGAAISRGRALPLVLVLLVPLLSVWVYREWGSGQDLVLPELMQRLAAVETEEQQRELLTELAAVLQQRFDRETDDLQNGYMLGTLYEELGRYDAAETTFRRMLGQMEPNPDKATVYGQLARTLYQQTDSELTPAVQQALDEALALNPNEYYSMGLLANDAFLREDMRAALGYWRRQLSSATPGSQQATSLRQVIAMVESYLPGEEQAQAADGPTITVVIDLDPALQARLDSMQSLFVYVRNPAMPMPLLAQNLAVPEFPFTLTLDESMSMSGVPVDLSATPSLMVGARLSATGNAIAQSGDLQTVSEPFSLEQLEELEGPLRLTIDQAVP